MLNAHENKTKKGVPVKSCSRYLPQRENSVALHIISIWYITKYSYLSTVNIVLLIRTQ